MIDFPIKLVTAQNILYVFAEMKDDSKKVLLAYSVMKAVKLCQKMLRKKNLKYALRSSSLLKSNLKSQKFASVLLVFI
jgi:hypothetical protein